MGKYYITEEETEASFAFVTFSEEVPLTFQPTSIDKCERRKDKRLLRKYAPHEIMLDDQQHDELLKLVTEIDTTGSDNLHSVYSEAEQHGARSVFESSWNLDLQRNKKLFEKDQRRNGNE